MGKLTDKVALITGSDSGIGHATAVEFAREGADVIVNYLQDEQVPTGLAPKSRARAARRSSYKPITATRTKSKAVRRRPQGIRPQAPPRTREKSWVGRSLLGHAHVLAITNAAKRSGWRTATANPIGPPQSCTIIVTSVRSRRRTNCSRMSACSAR